MFPASGHTDPRHSGNRSFEYFWRAERERKKCRIYVTEVLSLQLMHQRTFEPNPPGQVMRKLKLGVANYFFFITKFSFSRILKMDLTPCERVKPTEEEKNRKVRIYGARFCEIMKLQSAEYGLDLDIHLIAILFGRSVRVSLF